MFISFGPYLNKLYNQMNRIYFKIYDKLKNNENISAYWWCLIFNSLIISKMQYGIVFWSNGDKKIINKIKILYNKLARTCCTNIISAPILYQLMCIKWNDFDEFIKIKKAIFFTRLLRAPSTNIISKRMSIWKRWNKIRRDKQNLFV